MTNEAGLDIRIPIGALFTILGLLLAVFGMATASDAALYEISGSLNINLWWGALMAIFGIVLLGFARRGRRASGVHPAMDTPRGRATEAREQTLDLED